MELLKGVINLIISAASIVDSDILVALYIYYFAIVAALLLVKIFRGVKKR